MKPLYICFLVLLASFWLNAQNTTISPTSFIPPKLSFEAILAIPNPEKGSVVFDTSNNLLRMYNGTKWVYIETSKDNPIGAQAWTAPGNDNEGGKSVTVDNNGNMYVAGFFHDKITFGATTLTAAGLRDIFIVKYNKNGVVQWARRAGGAGNEYPYKIVSDSMGNIYIAGDYEQSATFGSSTVYSVGALDGFLAKYNTNGSLLWIRSLGGIHQDSANGVTLDAAENVYISGSFSNTVTFGGTTTLTSTGSSDIFIAKFLSNGTFQWVKQSGGNAASGKTNAGIGIDSTGNLYVTGFFSYTATFDSYSITALGDYDVFVAQYNPGTQLWTFAGKLSGMKYEYAYDMAVSKSGEVYVTGHFEDTTNFGVSTFTSAGSFDIFLAKIDFSGNGASWARRIGGATSDLGFGVAVDKSGDVYITGMYNNSYAFSSTPDVFVAKYTNLGGLIWVQYFGGNASVGDIGQGITVDADKNVYVTGSFYQTAIFGQTTLSSVKYADYFLLKIWQ